MYTKLLVLKKNRKKSKLNYTLLKILVYVGLVPIFTSCVYYNTFFNAEKSFENASKIIEESSLLEEGEIPPQAKKLLDEAISNSYIVLDKYPDSKYIDDAYFIIANSHFIKGDFAISKEFLTRLKNEYPQSKYIGEARILLTYCHFRMEEFHFLGDDIKEITTTDLPSKYQFYLIYNLIAEMAINMDSTKLAFNYFEKSGQLTRSRSKKTSLYMKLVKIAEKNKLYTDVITYLDKLSEVAPMQIRLDAKLDWIKYNRQLGNYNDIITEIDNLLGQSEFQKIHMKLELERAKVYLDQRDFKTTKLLLSDFTSTYKRKDESAEAFYHLGYIALMEDFDLVLAKDYFDSAKKERSSSKYGKKAKDMKVVIENFSALQEEYEYKIEHPESNEDASKDSTALKFEDEMESFSLRNREQMSIPVARGRADATPDSLLFTIAEKLMFDFNKEDIALEKFKALVDQYPESKFRSQSLFVLSRFYPDGEWKSKLSDEYPESSYSTMIGGESDTLNTIVSKRDNVWNLISISIDSTANSFYNLFENERDTTSLYYYAFVLDYYLNDLEGAIVNYQEYASFENIYNNFTTIAKNRVNEIEESITIEEELVQQRLDYGNAINAYFDYEELDSVMILFDSVLAGRHSNYKTSAQRLKGAFNKIKSYYGFLEPDSSGNLDSLSLSTLDSVYYNLGDIFDYELGIEDSAKYYYKKVLNDFDNSMFRYKSMIAMNDLDSSGVWGTLLSVEFPNSLGFPDSTRLAEGFIGSSLNEDFIENQNDILAFLTEASENFTTPEPDTSMVEIDSDSIIINHPLLEFPSAEDIPFPPIETVDEVDMEVINEIQTMEEDSVTIIEDEPISTEIIESDTNIVIQIISELSVDSTWIEHIVIYGESLRSIAKKELGSELNWGLLYNWNKELVGYNPALIFPYQILKIKKPSSYDIEIVDEDVYIVSSGETLWSIAKTIYNDELAWSILLYDNKEQLENPDRIYPGYQLVIRTYLLELRSDN